MEVNSALIFYRAAKRRGEYFSLGTQTLRGIIVLVFAQSVNSSMECSYFKCSKIAKNASYLKKARTPLRMIAKK